MDKSIYSKKYQTVLTLLKESRLKAGITQVELAERLDETQTFVSKCERNERRIDVIELRAFCLAIGIDFVEFITRLEKELEKLAE